MTAEDRSPQAAQPVATDTQETGAGSANSTLEKIDADEAGPRIAFERTVHDFGEVAPQTVTAAQFLFGNFGHGLLRITQIERSRGLLVRLSKTEYERGETGVLEVELHAAAQLGLMRRPLIVHTNDTIQPRIALTVTARIVEKVRYEPRRLVFLLQEEKTVCDAITLTSMNDKPFSISGFTSTADCLSVDYNPAEQATKFVLQPRVRVQNVQESMNGLIHISLTHPECAKVTVPFKALGRFEISPLQLIIPDAEPGQPVVRKIRVQNNYGEDFDVASASSRSRLVEVVDVQKVGSGREFEVRITPPAPEGSAVGFTDMFVVDITGGPELAAFCRGFYAQDRVTQDRLTDMQKTYLNWTERYFASFLRRAEYATLSEATKRELEQMWIASLEQQGQPLYYEAINSLAAIRSTKAAKAMLRIATDPEQKDNRARWMAVRALGILGDESVVPDLIHLVYHYHQNTRLWAQISLVRLLGVNFGYDWQRWGQWWNEKEDAPRFSPERVSWTTKADWADVEDQQRKDKEFLANLEQ